ncbi:MAG: nitrate reductase [Chloroflexi bacterium]|nr:nitrate reductase [Chloroflexota bacterium]
MQRLALLKRLPLLVVVGLSLSLALQGKALAQQGPQLTSVAQSKLLTDPMDAAWQKVPAADVPLTPQAGVKPALMATSVSSVKVRSVNDGASIAFLLEWQDGSEDRYASRPESFRDAAAIQFPTTGELPAICMGVRGQMVNIWHWKADWQTDIDKGFQDVPDAYPNFYKDAYPAVNVLTGTPPFRMPKDFESPEAKQFMVGWTVGNALSEPVRTSPIEDLNAIGFSTATHKAKQNVNGKGVWKDGVWRVVYTRALKVDDVDAAALTAGQEVPVAFAVWNGSNQEVGARKQTSTFLNVTVQAAGGAAALQLSPALLGGLILLLIVAGIIAFRMVEGRSRQTS